MGPLVERLRRELQRDPTDRDVAFLLTLAVRTPRVIYPGEEGRLRQLAKAQAGRTPREALVAEATAQLLARRIPSGD